MSEIRPLFKILAQLCSSPVIETGMIPIIDHATAISTREDLVPMLRGSHEMYRNVCNLCRACLGLELEMAIGSVSVRIRVSIGLIR